MNLAVIFGSSSNEHEVSVMSGSSIIKHLDKEKYNIVPLYMDKENNFYKWDQDPKTIDILEFGTYPTPLIPVFDIFNYLKTFDLVFIMIHGKNSEDGKLSSLLDFLKIKYVGHNPESSLITMDKILTKEILEANNITTAPYLSFHKYNSEYILNGKSTNLNEIIKHINNTLKYPLFVKPSRSGSSLGISKVSTKKELRKALKNALKVDNKILVEEEIIGREIECAVLEHNGKIIPSSIGEVKPENDFYSYKSKYQSSTPNTIIPAYLPTEVSDNIKKLAINIFKILDCHLYSRIDFFLTQDNKIILNEINTIPGFTNISMYPALFANIGIPYSKLLDILIAESLKS